MFLLVDERIRIRIRILVAQTLTDPASDPEHWIGICAESFCLCLQNNRLREPRNRIYFLKTKRTSKNSVNYYSNGTYVQNTDINIWMPSKFATKEETTNLIFYDERAIFSEISWLRSPTMQCCAGSGTAWVSSFWDARSGSVSEWTARSGSASKSEAGTGSTSVSK